MDTLTHIAVGACIGEAMAGKVLGRKAMLWGILLHSLPDIDFMAGLWLTETENLLAHRGITHSILFLVVVTPLIAVFASWLHAAHALGLKRWMAFFYVAVAAHIFIDTFNNYGVGLLEPFSNLRFSFNTIYVADPFFTIGPLAAMIALLLLKKRNPSRRKWWAWGIGLAMVYTIYAVAHKLQINRDVKKSLVSQQIPYKDYFSTPAPFQTWLWFVVVKQDTTFKISYRSVFDKKSELSWRTIERNDALLDSFPDQKSVQQLKSFSQGYYSGERYGDTVVLNDFRFGQEVGWYDSLGKIAFHYYLNYPDQNALVVQRGRFARWNAEVFKHYLRRIAGK